MTQSQAHPLYSLDYGAAGKASEAIWKPNFVSKYNQGFRCKPILLKRKKLRRLENLLNSSYYFNSEAINTLPNGVLLSAFGS